jgi:hypothetical protein
LWVESGHSRWGVFRVSFGGRLAERFAGLARRSGYPHSETPGAVSPFIGIPHARYVP